MKIRIRWDLAKQLIADIEAVSTVAACKRLRHSHFLGLKVCKDIANAVRDGNFELEQVHILAPTVLVIQVEINEITLDTTNTPPV